MDFTINFKNNEFVELRYLKRSKYYMKQERTYLKIQCIQII
jgi:hypothetical protein